MWPTEVHSPRGGPPRKRPRRSKRKSSSARPRPFIKQSWFTDNERWVEHNVVDLKMHQEFNRISCAFLPPDVAEPIRARSRKLDLDIAKLDKDFLEYKSEFCSKKKSTRQAFVKHEPLSNNSNGSDDDDFNQALRAIAIKHEPLSAESDNEDTLDVCGISGD